MKEMLRDARPKVNIWKLSFLSGETWHKIIWHHLKTETVDLCTEFDMLSFFFQMKVKALMMISRWSRWLKNHQLKNSWRRQSRICWKMPTWRKLQWSRLPDKYVISKHISGFTVARSTLWSVNVIALTKYQTKGVFKQMRRLTFNAYSLFWSVPTDVLDTRYGPLMFEILTSFQERIIDELVLHCRFITSILTLIWPAERNSSRIQLKV